MHADNSITHSAHKACIENGVLHGDISLNNIVLVAGGSKLRTGYLIDFDYASSCSSADGSGEQTVSPLFFVVSELINADYLTGDTAIYGNRNVDEESTAELRKSRRGILSEWETRSRIPVLRSFVHLHIFFWTSSKDEAGRLAEIAYECATRGMGRPIGILANFPFLRSSQTQPYG